VICEGEKVAVRDVFRGTHHGDFMGIPATGNRVTMEAIHIYRFNEGTLAEHWVARDDLGMMRQLGVVLRPIEATLEETRSKSSLRLLSGENGPPDPQDEPPDRWYRSTAVPILPRVATYRGGSLADGAGTSPITTCRTRSKRKEGLP
jgi:hypothetical protein